MPFIYRVENEEYMGPYVTDFAALCRGLPFEGAPHQPAPQWDGLNVFPGRNKFGFKDIDALIDWFDIAFNDLENLSFRVVRIWVEERDVTHGRKQLMFVEYPEHCIEQTRETIPWENVRELAGVSS